MNEADFAKSLAQKANDEPVVVSWWTRGGEPGPGYTSDKLDMRATRADAEGIYIRARFDQNYDPPFLAEEYATRVPQDLWRKLVDALAAERWIEVKFASEGRANLADAIKDTIRVEIGKSVFEKTLYQSPQGELGAAKQARNEIAQYLVDRGARTVRSKLKQQQ